MTLREQSIKELRIIENERSNFYSLFLQTPEMVCILQGPEHRFIFVNPAHERALGFNATGLTVREAQPESVEVHGILDQVFATGKTAELREITVTLNDRRRYFNLTYSASKDIDGKISGILILGSEVTEVVEARTILKSSEEQVVNILESMSEAFFAVDKNWNIIRVNAKHEELSQIKRENQLGKNFLTVFFSNRKIRENSKSLKTYIEAMESRKAVYVEDYYGPLDKTCAVNVYPQLDGGLAFFFRDISNEKQAEVELKKAILARDAFLGIASHELKTPLTSLKLQSEINRRYLKKSGPGFFTAEILEKLIQNPLIQAERLSRLVDDMLDASRIASGKLSIELKEIDLSNLLENTLKGFSIQLDLAKCSVSKKITPEVMVEADALRIEQVIANLISNTLKYASGKPLEISLRKTKDSAVLKFRDHGPGIPKENLDQIFERYERLVSPSEISGLGLGLFISKEIVERHAGKITAISEFGQGTEFTVELPLVQL